MFERMNTRPDPSGGPVVLVVEDQAPLRRLYRHMLVALGYDVHLAASGGEAVDRVTSDGLRPELLLTDVVMPDLNGPELAERLRALVPGLRVVYMSGYTGDAMGAQGLLDPGTPFLQKPFDAVALGACLVEAAGGPER